MAIATNNIVEKKTVKDGKKHLKTVALRAYKTQKRRSLEEQRIEQLLPMVPKIVRRVITYLKPPLSFEDLVSAGTVGLIKAARDYDPSHQAEFKTYAYIRIRGAVLDELREWSFVPSNLNRQIRNAFELSRKITEKTGSVPEDDKLAEMLGITIDELYEIFKSARAQRFLSIDSDNSNAPALIDITASLNTTTPDEQIEQAELIDKLSEEIQKLSEKQRKIILLYYQQHLTMKQTAEVLKITESRVSQLHASALFNLSIKLRQWKNAR